MCMGFNLPFTMAASIKSLNKLSIDSSVFYIYKQMCQTQKWYFQRGSQSTCFFHDSIYHQPRFVWGFFSHVDAAVTIK